MKTLLLICSEPSISWFTYSLAIVNAIAKSNKYNVIFMHCVQDENYSKLEELIDSNVKKITIKLPLNKWLRLLFRLYPFKILQEINKIEKIDLIHLLSTEYTFANILKKLQKKHSIIYTVHNLIPHQQKGQKNVSLYLKYINYAMEKCHKICNNLCTCSLEQLEQLKLIYPKKKVFFHTLPNQVSDLTKQGTLTCPELKNESGYILFFGRVDVYKGIELLHKAFLNSGLRMKLVIAGKSTENYAPIKNSEKIIFINRFIKVEEIKPLFENAAVVIYPYISITQSGVLSFPYYFGVPVVASDLPYFKDQIIDKETGLLFKTGDADDLTDKLKMIFNGSFDLEKMKIAEKEQFENIFGEKRLSDELMNMYNSFIE